MATNQKALEEREQQAVDYIKANANLSDLAVVEKIYQQLSKQGTFQTAIGLGFLQELETLLLPEEEPEEIVFYEAPDPEDEPDFRDINIDQDEDGVFVLTGKQLRKIFDSTNFNDTGSLRYLYKYIESKGAIDQLIEMGLEEGDTIKVFDYEFEYYEE